MDKICKNCKYYYPSYDYDLDKEQFFGDCNNGKLIDFMPIDYAYDNMDIMKT